MKTDLQYYQVVDELRKKFESSYAAVRTAKAKPIPGEPFISGETAVTLAAQVLHNLLKKKTRNLQMERVAATGMTITAITAVAAAILYFLHLPILSDIAVAWTIVMGIISAAGFAIMLFVRSIWDND
jgi:hypothetical protein